MKAWKDDDKKAAKKQLRERDKLIQVEMKTVK